MRRVQLSLLGLVLGVTTLLPGCGDKKDGTAAPTIKARQLPQPPKAKSKSG
jgi:hypothetical protein